MRIKKLFSAFLIFGVIGCSAALYTGPEFQHSRELVNQTYKVCMKDSNNEPLARQECFPILTNQEILVQIKEISDSFNLQLEGIPGDDSYRVDCEPSKQDAERIRNDPKLVEVGKNYYVKGKVTRVHLMGSLNFFTLSDCNFRKQ